MTPRPLDRVTHVGIDADDTLWHSENRFQEVHRRFHELVGAHADVDPELLERRMLETERRNLRLFGYGAKGFTLSLIETALELTDRRIPAAEIETIISFGKELLDHPVELLDNVVEGLDALDALGLDLLLVTKGDLWHQESKIAASGLAERFRSVEIVSEKDERTYRSVLERNGVGEPSNFVMVGNSVRSDVLPVIGIGGHGVHVPYEYLWAHEAVDEPQGRAPSHHVIADLTELAPLLDGGRPAGGVAEAD